jgi:hypothetical protein
VSTLPGEVLSFWVLVLSYHTRGSIDDKDSVRFDSFTNILAYLQEALGQEQIRDDND